MGTVGCRPPQHISTLFGTASQTFPVSVCGMASAAASVTTWRVDDSHGQFFNQWWSDMTAANITDVNPGWVALARWSPGVIACGRGWRRGD